ncbi:low molecular weight phosphotyrosine protein phosphatase [Listeria floridensis FSL S10-1187]|uniref:Low molecular weight phosphotyrosine protein phosphatase n=1 Tax=Listeria floridensis FSL S10-1187 TaxID=1265817 RepID=A0ABN0RG20_9LIST|nr:phosphatase [Listeria floridensis]EUJ32716.1 low molecular weight phosphotyrosine protein phosphatase [Listeria floridensis FSL S10-1187]
MNILFVCTGNTCRSPLAEGILKSIRPDLNVRSRGIAAHTGEAISDWAGQILLENGIELAHSAMLLTEGDIDWANQIFVMTSEQLALLGTLFPEKKRKIDLIAQDGSNIADPFLGGRVEYQATFDALKTALRERFE